MEMLWTVVWFVLSWVIWLLWKVFVGIFWGIFGFPLLVVLIIAAVLLWRVGPSETIRRLGELRQAVVPALRAFSIAIISLVSTMTGVSVMQKLPVRIQKVLTGGASYAPTRVETKTVEVQKLVYRCGPIARLFNIFYILYGLVQFTVACTILGVILSLFS